MYLGENLMGGGGCDGMAWDGIRRRLTNKAVA